MSSKIFTDISVLSGIHNPSRPLRGKDLAEFPVIKNGYLVVEGHEIADFGEMADCKYRGESLGDSCMVLPAWCDSHTHLVFAESREEEFVKKIRGATYAEIAASGGGILNSAKKIAEYSEDKLFELAWQRLLEVSKMGTGAIEIKSGYGLSYEGELKILRVIRRLKEKSNLLIRTTFLGAHAFPEMFRDREDAYIHMLTEELLPVIAKENLADYIDAFCEKGFFSPEQTVRICKAGEAYGLRPKLHVNQLNSIGGIEAGIECNALSLDHLETLTELEVNLLGNFQGISTLLPTAAFFLRMKMPPARDLINANAAISLATDFNPGSSPSGNMHLVVAMACIQMRMLPSESINAATINGAFAMEVETLAGSIARGKQANLIFTRPIPSLDFIPYSFGHNPIDRVMIQGEFI